MKLACWAAITDMINEDVGADETITMDLRYVKPSRAVFLDLPRRRG